MKNATNNYYKKQARTIRKVSISIATKVGMKDQQATLNNGEISLNFVKSNRNLIDHLTKPGVNNLMHCISGGVGVNPTNE